MEENKKINYLIVTSSVSNRQSIGKTDLPVSAGDVVLVRSHETESLCTVDAVVSVDADSDVASFIDSLRCVMQTEIKTVWKFTNTQ